MSVEKKNGSKSTEILSIERRKKIYLESNPLPADRSFSLRAQILSNNPTCYAVMIFVAVMHLANYLLQPLLFPYNEESVCF